MASDKVDGINYLTISKGDDTSYFEIAKAQLGDGAKEAKIEALAGKIEELNENKKLKEGDQVFIPFEYAVDEMQANVKAAQTNVTTKQTALKTAQNNLNSASGEVAKTLSAYSSAMNKPITKKVKDSKTGKEKTVTDEDAVNAQKKARDNYEAALKKEEEMRTALQTAQTELDKANKAVETANSQLEASKSAMQEQDDLTKKEKQKIESQINALQGQIKNGQEGAKESQKLLEAQNKEADMAAEQNQKIGETIKDKPSKENFALAMNNTISSVEYSRGKDGKTKQTVTYADGTTAENKQRTEKDKDGNEVVYYGNAIKDENGKVRLDTNGNVLKEKDDNGYIKKKNSEDEKKYIFGGKDGKTKYTVIDTLVDDDDDEIEIEDDAYLSIEDGSVYKVEDEDGNEFIYVKNAEDVNLNAKKSDEDINIIIDSCDIDEIALGKGDDNIFVNNSTLERDSVNYNEIYDNTHIDRVYLESSGNFSTGDGDDEVTINNSTLDAGVDTGWGDDEIVLNNSGVSGIAAGGDGDDFVYLKDSHAGTYTQNHGYDEDEILEPLKDGKISGKISTGDYGTIILENSTAHYIYTSSEADTVLIKDSSYTGTLDTQMGSDAVAIEDDSYVLQCLNVDDDSNVVNIDESYIKKFDIDGGVVAATNSEIDTLEADKNEVVVINDGSTISNMEGNVREIPDQHDKYTGTVNANELASKNGISKDEAGEIIDDNQNQAKSSSRSIAEKYFGKDTIITAEQETQAILIDNLEQNLLNMQYQFENQNEEDGIVAQGYNLFKGSNFFKGLVGCGVNDKDIEEALDKQEEIIEKLKDAMVGKTDKSFKETYKDLMGVDYDEEKVANYLETYNTYRLVTTGLGKSTGAEDAIQNVNNMQEVLEICTEYYGGDETMALEVINKALKEDCSKVYGKDTESAEITSSFFGGKQTHKLLLRFSDGTTEERDLSDVYNDFRERDGAGAKNKTHLNSSFLSDQFKDNFEDKMGVSVEDLQAQLKKEEFQALGTNTVFQRLLNDYCKDQSEVSKKVSEFLTRTGMATVIGGALVATFCPPAGAVMMKVGGKVMTAGMFADEGLGALDEVTSGNCNPDELKGYFGEFATDAALYFAGRGINRVSGAANQGAQNLISKGTSSVIAQKVGGYAVEVMVDGSLSLAADAIITGNVDFTGEGFNQLMGIATGIAASKINNYSKKVASEAMEKYPDNPEAAVAKMKEDGLTKKQIKSVCDTQYGKDKISMKNITEAEPNIEPKSYTDTNDYTKYDSVSSDQKYNTIIDAGFGEDFATEVSKYDSKKYGRVVKMIEKGNDLEIDLKEIANYNDEQYGRFEHLNEKGLYSCGTDIINNDILFARTDDLLSKNFKGHDAYEIASDSSNYHKTSELLKRNVEPDSIIKMLKYETNDYNKAIKLIDNGFSDKDIDTIITKKNKYDVDELINLKNSINKINIDNSEAYNSIAWFTSENPDIDIEKFTKYMDKINFGDLCKTCPAIKNYTSGQYLDFVYEHYKNKDTKFDSKTLTFKKDMTSYIQDNYLTPQELNKLYNAYPETPREVGTMPDKWLDNVSKNNRATATQDVYSAISDFQKTEDISALENKLGKAMNKKVTVKEIGKGEFGTAYKISVEGSPDMCLKTFFDDDHSYNGASSEVQTAMFVNEHSDAFAKMYCGKVSPDFDNDGFMITEYLDENTTPAKQSSHKKGGYKITCRDQKQGNIINGKIIDFGEIEVEKK